MPPPSPGGRWRSRSRRRAPPRGSTAARTRPGGPRRSGAPGSGRSTSASARTSSKASSKRTKEFQREHPGRNRRSPRGQSSRPLGSAGRRSPKREGAEPPLPSSGRQVRPISIEPAGSRPAARSRCRRGSRRRCPRTDRRGPRSRWRAVPRAWPRGRRACGRPTPRRGRGASASRSSESRAAAR